MKRHNIYLPMAALILTAALAVPAAAQNLVPCGPGVAPVCFNGTFQGSDDTSHEPTLVQSMTGIGTHVGQFSSTTTLTVTASGGTGSAQWVAANGDTIATAVVGTPEGLSTPPCQVVGAKPGDHFLKVTETHIITGGTIVPVAVCLEQDQLCICNHQPPSGAHAQACIRGDSEMRSTIKSASNQRRRERGLFAKVD